MKDHEHHRRRTAILMLRDRIRSLKSGCARRSVTHVFMLTHTHHADTMHIKHGHALRKSNKQNQHTNIEQFHLSPRLWILFCVLLVSRSPNTCSGTCATHVPNHARTRNLSHVITLDRHWHTCFHSSSYPKNCNSAALPLPHL